MNRNEILHDWMCLLKWFDGPDYDSVIDHLNHEGVAGHDILPPTDMVFNAFSYALWHDVRVVFVGQCPYTDPAHNTQGLAFSVPDGTSPLPQPLQNIFTELELDYGRIPDTGNLDEWAKQGVLLLNTAFTARSGDAEFSHADFGWESLIDETIRYLSRESLGVVFVLWGPDALKWLPRINTKDHLVIFSAGPDDISTTKYSFFGSRPFSRSNKYLIKCGFDPIKWDHECDKIDTDV